jgi:carbamoyl-phosphate synthase large subunit
MEVLRSENEVVRFLNIDDQSFLETGPLLIERYLEHAKEVDLDAISDGKDVYIAGIMEHFEKAGIHSGDSTCALPSFSLSEDMSLLSLKGHTFTLCKALEIQGLINIQFAIIGEEIFILEVNPRASRTLPFVL